MNRLSCGLLWAVVGQKHLTFRGFRTSFLPRDIHKKSSQHEHACAPDDDTICPKHRKNVPYHGDSPNSRFSARLRSPSPMMLLIIGNGNRPEWSPIRSVIIRLMTKSVCNQEYDLRPNWTTRSLTTYSS